MKAKIVCLDYSNHTKLKQSLISKKIYGYVDKTQGGKYVYERPGLLTELKKIILGKA